MINSYYNWFDLYVKGFYGEDALVNQNIKLKEEHTLKVAKHSLEIANSLKLSEEEKSIAEIIGLFHDIGRFEQFKKYKTFRDNLSVNHSILGIRILEEHKVLHNLPEETKDIITKAICYHNKKELPNSLLGEEAIFCKIIRDADKLDIYRVILKHEKERQLNPNPALDNLPFTEDYNKNIIKEILAGRKLSNSQLKCYNDRKLYELGWILDLNFPFSFKYIKTKNILEDLTKCLPQTEEIIGLYKFLDNYIQEHLQ